MEDMRNGRCALCGHDEVWHAPIKFSVVEPGASAAEGDRDGPGLLATLVCAKCGHLQWFMENVAAWRSAMLDSGHAPMPSFPPKEEPVKSKPVAASKSAAAPVSEPGSAVPSNGRPPPPTSHGPRTAPPADEPHVVWDVRLLSADDVEGDVAHVLESFGIDSSKAYALAFDAPVTVAEGVSKLQAERFRAALLANGAVASIEIAAAPSVVVSHASQPPGAAPMCRGCAKPMLHHQIMITEQGQLCPECYRELETQG